VFHPRLVIPHGYRRIHSATRFIRAVWRDTLALWGEFNRPVIIFMVTTLGGGLLYGELLVIGGYERLPYYDLPYLILQMMVFEPPGEIPPQPYLTVFWYTMPLIGLYIIGRGAIDFVRLFFNRDARRDAWEAAVASTYRNHIIVLGVGHIGLRVTRTLVHMGFDVVAIDIHVSDVLDAELRSYHVPAIVADGRLPSTLEAAGLKYARAIVVCTSDDHLNLEVTMRCRDLNPDIRIVVRMWDNQFAAQLNRFMGVEAVLSASDLAAPAFAGAAVGIEITQTLKINDVEYSMIRLDVQPDSFMDGQTIDVLQEDNDIDIVLHGHNDAMEVHPDGDIPVNAGDTLVIFARHDKITDIVSRNRLGMNGAD